MYKEESELGQRMLAMRTATFSKNGFHDFQNPAAFSACLLTWFELAGWVVAFFS